MLLAQIKLTTMKSNLIICRMNCVFVCRQENLGLQARYNAMEHRSKDVLVSQSAAMSGANVALASLSGRLEHLVEQLISTYNISERDLEVSFLLLTKIRLFSIHSTKPN